MTFQLKKPNDETVYAACDTLPHYDTEHHTWRTPEWNFYDPTAVYFVVANETALTVKLPLLTPMTLYMAFTPAERIAIKISKDPMVMEFWAMFQLSAQLQKPTDPNLVSVREAIEYLAAPAVPGPGAGILASPERIEQILQGIPQ